jgi:LysR family transcriptional regulator, nitrogen assimilation regulatory protein
MNLRYWQHFLRIAESGSLSRVAERIGVAQPVLSREMRELEAQLGVTLLRRHARGVSLTVAGEMFRRRAETILAQIDGLSCELNAAAHEPAGTLSFGVPQSMSTLLTMPLVAAFRARFPAVRLHVRESTAMQIRDGLLAREIEIGILASPPVELQLTTMPLLKEPMVLVGPESADLDPAFPVSLAAVAALPLIMARRPNSTRIALEHALESLGLTPDIPIETDQAPLAEFVRQGFGYSVVPGCFVAAPASQSLRYAPVVGLEISWMIGYLRGADLSNGAICLQDMIAMVVGDAIAEGRWGAIPLG